MRAALSDVAREQEEIYGESGSSNQNRTSSRRYDLRHRVQTQTETDRRRNRHKNCTYYLS